MEQRKNSSRRSSPHPTTFRNGRSSYSTTNSHTRQSSSSHFNDSPYTKYFLQQSPVVDTKKIPEEKEMEFILKKSQRSVNEAILLYKQLKSFHFFQKFQHENSHLRIIEALIHLSKIVQYEFYPAETIIYQKGDPSNKKIYLIYSGEVASWNSKPLSDEDKIAQNPAIIESSLQHIEEEKKEGEKLTKLNLNFGLIKLTNLQKGPPPPKQLRRLSHFNFAHAKSLLTKSENDINRHNSHGSLESSSHNNPKVMFKNSIDLSKITRFSSKSAISTSRSHRQQQPSPSQKSEGGCESSQRVLKRTFIKGRHFGDKTLKSKGGPREETVMALTDCVFLSFTEEDYKYLLTRFNSKNFGLLNFLLDCIPGFEKIFKYLRIKNFESYFKEEIFSLHAPIISEAKNGDKIYLLYKGFCEITKLVQTPAPRNALNSPQGKKVQSSFQKITICQIRPGVFIGEEILFKENADYDQTVQALSSTTKVLSIEKDVFKQIMPEEILDELKKLYLSKTQHNEKLLLQKTQNTKNKSCSNFYEKQHRPVLIRRRKDSFASQNYIEIKSSSQLTESSDSYQNFLQFEDRIHQYWRTGMLKNSKLLDSSGIRSNNNNTAFRNKPYFRKKLEEKFSQKNALKSCFSPIKEITKVQKRSKTSSSCDAQSKQNPIDNVNAFHKRVLTTISPKNADLLLKPPIKIFGNKTFTSETNKIYYDEIDEGKRRGPKPVRVIKTESSPNKITVLRLENSFENPVQFARFNLLCFGASQVPKIKKNQKEVYGFHNRKSMKSKTPTHF